MRKRIDRVEGKKKYPTEIAYGILFVLFGLVLVLGLFLPVCRNDYINYDSSYQYFLTQHSLSEIWALIPEDYSPPLYSVLLKGFCVLFGHTLFTMRVFSLLLFLGVLFLAMVPVRRVFGTKAGVLDAVVVLSSSAILYILPEIRPTVLAFLTMTASAVYACELQFCETRRAYIAFTVFTVLGMYTHNVAMLGSIGIYAVLLVYATAQKNFKKLRNILISGVVSAVSYLPWLLVVFQQFAHVQEHYWTTELTLFDAFFLLYDVSLSKYTQHGISLFVVVLELAIAVSLIRMIDWNGAKNAKRFRDIRFALEPLVQKVGEFHKRTEGKIPFLCCMSLAPLLVLGGFHILAYPLISDRYVFIYSGIYFLLLAVVMASFGRRALFALFAGAMILNGVLCNRTVRDDIALAQIREMKEVIYAGHPDGDVAFLHFHEYELGTLSYYFPKARHYVCDDTFTVLRTYDVFTTDVTEIGEVENIWDYEEEFYFVSDPVFTTQKIIDQEELKEKISGGNYDFYGSFHQPISYSDAYLLFEFEKLPDGDGGMRE